MHHDLIHFIRTHFDFTGMERKRGSKEVKERQGGNRERERERERDEQLVFCLSFLIACLSSIIVVLPCLFHKIHSCNLWNINQKKVYFQMHSNKLFLCTVFLFLLLRHCYILIFLSAYDGKIWITNIQQTSCQLNTSDYKAMTKMYFTHNCEILQTAHALLLMTLGNTCVVHVKSLLL